MFAKIEKAKKDYSALLKIHRRQKIAAKKKLNAACLLVIEKTTSAVPASRAFMETPYGIPAKLRALEKWAELCETPREAEKAYEACGHRFRFAESPVVLKWEELSKIAIEKANTKEECIEAINGALRSRPYQYSLPEPADIMGYKKLLNLCKSVQELREVSNLRGAYYIGWADDRFSKLGAERREILELEEKNKKE